MPRITSLTKPTGLGDDAWLAIIEARDRLIAAKAASDHALVVGSAKELCESVASVVIAARGDVAASSATMPDLLKKAHKALAYQPGPDLANDDETRKVAQGLMTIVIGLTEMRNRIGTGHGRASSSEAISEHSGMAYESAVLWCDWALRRLGPYIAGDVASLVRDLDDKTFYRGDLARRLELANLGRLSLEDQRRLGIAVGQRAGRGTFMARGEGIGAAQPGDPRWPDGYVEGVLTGMFFDKFGNLALEPWRIDEAARLIAALPNPRKIAEPWADRVATAAASRRVARDPERWRDAADAFAGSADVVAAVGLDEAWRSIEAAIRVVVGDDISVPGYD